MAETKFGMAKILDDEDDDNVDDTYGEEIIADIAEDFSEHANMFPDFDRRLIQEMISTAEANFKFKPKEWSDLLMRLQAVIDDYKSADDETDEDDLRSELQELSSEARDLTVH